MSYEDLSFWLAWCIEEYGAEKKMIASDVAELFENRKIFDYLSENVEVLHTQGRDYILGSIDDFLTSHKGE